MPEKKIDIDTNHFIERLVEVCRTNQPAELAQKLQISYQAARNYLNGRLPDTNVLLLIAERTEYSIHWLLTGKGEKFALKKKDSDTLLLSDQMKTFVRRQCVEVFNELFALRDKPVQSEKEIEQQKIVKVASDGIKFEAIKENSSIFTKK
ncbi:MAG TPA: helix-turn-helix domain-containing protein [Pyrinomonadaceae bacterium]|nr:helix-turn-helix domain-containing protein [Pyrinomonadaceae bacterium]